MVNYLTGDFTLIEYDECKPNPYPDGYGRKIPTRYTVRFWGYKREYEVWAMCYSNCASHYIKYRGQERFIRDSRF